MPRTKPGRKRRKLFLKKHKRVRILKHVAGHMQHYYIRKITSKTGK